MKWHLLFLLLISGIAVLSGGWFPHGTPSGIIVNGAPQFWFNGYPTVVVNSANPQFWFNGIPNQGPIQ